MQQVSRVVPVKILYHHRTASKDGQAVHIEELIAALRELGHEVRVVGPTASGDAGMGSQVGWVELVRSGLPRALYELMELGYSLVAYRRLVRAAREFDPDVVYERYNLYLLAGLMLKRRRGIPLLLEVNAPLVEERERFGGLALPRLARWAERTAWRGADIVLPVTGVLASYLQASGVPPERAVVIPNGINEAQFAAAPAPAAAKVALGCDAALVLGFTGFVRDWHGLDRVIPWLAGPDAPANAQLLIVGDGPARPGLERLVSEFSLARRVRFTGVVPRERVPELVSAFDVALQPAVVPYASPLKLFEYLALGKAIVAPRLPNIMEVLQDGVNAVLFDPEDSRGLEQALTRVCADGVLRHRVAAGARETIAKNGLTWRRNAERIAGLAQELHRSHVDGRHASVGAGS